MESKTLLQLNHFRVHTISKLDPNAFNPGKSPRITDKAFIDMPVRYGLAIEAKTADKDENGEDIYYVLAFVHWNAENGEIEYDALLDRVADEWATSDDPFGSGIEFQHALRFAEAEVEKANRGDYE